MSTSTDLNVMGMVGYKLKFAQHTLRLHMDDALKSLSLTTPQYAVLSQLELKPGISNADLARSSFITPQTMHSIVANLEKNVLVKRKSNPQHGRILCVALTPQGQKIVQQAHQIIKKIEDDMTRTMDDKDKLLLEKLLADCVSNLAARHV